MASKPYDCVLRSYRLWESVPFSGRKHCKASPTAFLGRTEERESRFPRVRLLGLIKDDKYEGWENLIALNVIRLYLNRIRYEMGSQCSFCR